MTEACDLKKKKLLCFNCERIVIIFYNNNNNNNK